MPPAETGDGEVALLDAHADVPATTHQQRRRNRRQRRRGGRKSLLETGKKQVLLTAISNGNRLPVAARLAGLSPRTPEELLQRCRVDGGD